MGGKIYKRIIAVTMFLALGTLMVPITEANATVIWRDHIMVPVIWEETIPCSGDYIVLEGYLQRAR
jgi:hypothetical protein